LATLGIGAATLLTWTQAATLFDNHAPNALPIALLALACGALFALVTYRGSALELLYGAAINGGVSLLCALTWQHAPSGAYPCALLTYGGVLCLLASRCRTLRPEGIGLIVCEWREPLELSGQIAAGLGALCAAMLPLNLGLNAAGMGTALTLTLGIAFYTLTARQQKSAPAVGAALACAAYASALLTWKLLPGAHHLTVCLIPFVVASGIVSLWFAPRAKEAEDARAWWREPLALGGQLAIALCLAECLSLLLNGTFRAQAVGMSLLPVAVSALLIFLSRRRGGVDGAVTLCAASTLALSAFAGWPLHDPNRLVALCGEIALLGWAWWLLGEALSRRGNGAGSEEMKFAGLATVFASALLAAWAVPASLWTAGCLASVAALCLLRVHQMQREDALTLSWLSLLWLACNGDAHPATHFAVTTLLTAFGILYAAIAATRRTPRTVAACALTLTGAYLNHLLAQTSLLPATPATLSLPHFAFLSVQAGLVWLGLGWHLRRLQQRADLAAPLLILAGSLSLASALLALLTVQTVGQGAWSILTLGWTGAVWFGLWLLESGESCLHIGVVSLLTAWSLVLYHYAPATPLDIYVLPVGLYLVTLGHRASHRARMEQAHALWWAGLLLTLTPTFYAYQQAPGSWHTLLLLAECLGATLWGIGRRIRAFVYAGLTFAGLYAASAVAGYLPGTWATLISLLFGVGLFVAGFYALMHRESVRRSMMFLEAQWRAWQAWR
jgi:hypothetical protein